MTYCEETLGIDNYMLFEEIALSLKKGKCSTVLARIDKGEFSDFLVYHIDRIYKTGYDPAYFSELTEKRRARVVIHTMN